MKKIQFILLTVMLLMDCNIVEEPEFESESNILALMKITGSDTGSIQYVKVDQSYDIKDTVESKGLRDAVVTVMSPEDTFIFIDSFYDESKDIWMQYNEGWYVLEIRLSDTTLYSLEVLMPGGDTVTGEAYMPSPISISYPEDSHTISISQQTVEPISVTWNQCKNTQYYMIICTPDVDTSQNDSFPPFLFLPSIWGDTSYTYFQERMILPWVYDMHYVLRVVALSPEYTDYFGLEGPGSDMGNLSSGYGMFGGISEDSIRVYIVP